MLQKHLSVKELTIMLLLMLIVCRHTSRQILKHGSHGAPREVAGLPPHLPVLAPPCKRAPTVVLSLLSPRASEDSWARTPRKGEWFHVMGPCQKKRTMLSRVGSCLLSAVPGIKSSSGLQRQWLAQPLQCQNSSMRPIEMLATWTPANGTRCVLGV